jgi:hypothetical protein
MLTESRQWMLFKYTVLTISLVLIPMLSAAPLQTLGAED